MSAPQKGYSFKEVDQHLMPGGPKVTTGYVALCKNGTTWINSKDWRGFISLALGDDDVLYLRFHGKPTGVGADTIHAHEKDSLIRIPWTEGYRIAPAYNLGQFASNIGSGFQIGKKGQTEGTVNPEYCFGFPSETTAKEWINFSPLARDNAKMLAGLLIPQETMTNRKFLKSIIIYYTKDSPTDDDNLVAYTSNHRSIRGPVMALGVESSRQGLNHDEMARILNEVQRCKQIQHPGVVKLYGINFGKKAGYGGDVDFPRLILERVYGPKENDPPLTLDDYLYPKNQYGMATSKTGVIPEIEFQVKLARSIADALAGLHQHAVHRDLNPVNILLVLGSDGKPTGDVKLFNYQMERFSSTEGIDSLQASATSPRYAAPEIDEYPSWRYGNYRTKHGIRTQAEKKIDIFSYGITLWELAAGQRAYPNARAADVRRAIKRGERPDLNIVPDSNPLKSIIKQCWADDPTQRPSAEEIIKSLTK